MTRHRLDLVRARLVDRGGSLFDTVLDRRRMRSPGCPSRTRDNV
jgi:hypothetical protein